MEKDIIMDEGKDFKYVNNDSDKLIVSFNYHNGGNKFFKYGTLIKNENYNYLFLTSDNQWYLENGGNKFKNFLTPYTKKFKPENTLFFGSSMGAYGALLHGLSFGVNVYTSNPQIDEEIVFKHIIPEKKNFANSLLKNKIKLLEIKELYSQAHNEPIIYYLCGDTPSDSENLLKFMSYIPSKIKLIVEKIPIKEHDYWTHTNEDIFCRLDIMQKMRNVTYSKYK